MADSGIYLSIKGPDITGESPDQKHQNMIECQSWSWGCSNSASVDTGPGAGTGEVAWQSLSITKVVDKSSNVLMQGCASGQHYTSATLYIRKAGGEPLDYVQLDMSGLVFISGYHVNQVGGGGSQPTETVSLSFKELMFTYNQQSDKGSGAGAAALGYNFTGHAKM